MPRKLRMPRTPRASQSRGCFPKLPNSKGGGGGGAPPQGVFNPPATEGVPTACRIYFQLALSNHSWPISTFFRAIRSEVFFPLSFPFPSGPGITGAQPQKIAFCVLLPHLGRFFRLPKRAWKMTSKKHRKKCENHGFWPPKPLPKPSQNPIKIEVPKNMRFFIDFCSMFFFFSIIDFLKIVVFPKENHCF